MTPEMPQVTPAQATPAAMPPSPPPAPNSLAEFRAQKASGFAPPATEPVAPTTPTEPPIAQDLDPPSVDEPDDAPDPPQAAQPDQPETPKGPEPASQKWKDPDTGMTLDLRRRDHRRMKRLLEERADLARQLAGYRQAPPPQAQPEPARPPQPVVATPDPNDPEPALEQFADQADPYGAFVAAQARWHARQEHRSLTAQHARVERARQVQAAISHAQEAYDAGLSSARERYTDFDEAHAEVLAELGRLPMPARTPLVHRLLTSPLRHDLTHYLGSHPEDLAAVTAARSAYEQGLVLGAIETRVRALVNQRTKSAPHPLAPPPAPMTPVGGSATPVAVPDASKINSLAQWRALKPKLGLRA